MSAVLDFVSIEGVDGEVVFTFILVLVIAAISIINFVKYARAIIERNQRRGNNLLIRPPQPSYNRSEEPCPVCFSNIVHAVETGCYHLFCGSCILELIQYARHRNIMCPVCRAQVLMLYPVFTVNEYNERDNDLSLTRDSLINEIQEYNHLFSGGSRTIIQILLELPVYLRRIWRSFNNPNDVLVQNRMKTLLYIIFFLVAIYILFPFDLFPEVYFGVFGYLDDLLVLAVSLLYVTNVYRSLFFHHE